MKNYLPTKCFLILMGVLMLSIAVTGQEGYRVTVKINGNSDTALLLTCYYGSKIKLVDTATLVSKGTFVFEGKSQLPGGIYMAVTPDKKKLFEFLIGKNQVFKLETDTVDYAVHMKTKGSDENQVFYDYLKFNELNYQQNKVIMTRLKEVEDSTIRYKELRDQLDSLNKRSIGYKMEVIANHPDLFVSTLFNAMRDVEVPDSVLHGSDSSQAFKYYKRHYWDHFDLSDSSLLRTPLIVNKLDQYFERAVFLHPDSVVVAIDDVISRVRPSYEMVSYLVWHFMSEYQNPKYMGFDNIFVHLVDQYFSKEAIQNTSPSVLTMLTDRANVIRPLLLGKQAPSLILVDTSGQLRSLYTLRHAYNLVLFWDYDCGICKREIADLEKIYNQKTYDLEIFSVCVNGDLDKWKKSIGDRHMPWINVNGTRSATPDFHDLYDIHGTPVIYLLDQEMKIIAKRISADQIPDLIDNVVQMKK